MAVRSSKLPIWGGSNLMQMYGVYIIIYMGVSKKNNGTPKWMVY